MNQTSAQRSSVVIGGHQDPIRVIDGHRSSPKAFKRVATVAATVAAAVAATVGAAVAATVGVMGAAEAEAMAEGGWRRGRRQWCIAMAVVDREGGGDGGNDGGGEGGSEHGGG